MLSLRSLAFILASAIRRARALSCAALFPDIIMRKIAPKIVTKNPPNIGTNMTAFSMCSLLQTLYPPTRSPGSCNALIVEVRRPE